MQFISLPSPNYDERTAPVEMVVLHYTGMKTAEEAISRLRDPVSKVSSHYVIDESGTIYQLVDDELRAWHAGISYWRGRRNVNANSIGIEIVNPGHEFGYREFTAEQYASIIELCSKIKRSYNIMDIDIVGHSDVAPDRKEDPGELFNWGLLAKNGIGIVAASRQKAISGDLRLTELGYELHNEKSIAAFQRHWRQNNINGQWDEECADILSCLVEIVNG